MLYAGNPVAGNASSRQLVNKEQGLAGGGDPVLSEAQEPGVYVVLWVPAPKEALLLK